MARKEFEQFEAVSAVVPAQMGVAGAYHAAIAVKALYEGGAPRFHKVLSEQTFATATAADAAAVEQLKRLQGVTDDAELVW
ncbi:hypothetical protein AQS70_00035 [Pseudomonas endophytica]|mgnify:CR=1 FL=1|uniref:Uncharacterized protein n=1 Tax=Pseudomonas endophytica TaxID=1563157 RepID=A0A0N8VTA2_9PSED|nr:hypothetical protein [Pseudomonas endophytica]KQB55556.1 hypothetical protein AQS70_00035 [Pseudomonas endophytica]